MTIVVVLAPYVVTKFLFAKWQADRITSEWFQKKYGALTESLEVERKESMLFNVAFMVRRIVYGLTVVLLYNHGFA